MTQQPTMSMETNTATTSLPYVHPSIAIILESKCHDPRPWIDPETLQLQWTLPTATTTIQEDDRNSSSNTSISVGDWVSMELLVEFACSSEQVLFDRPTTTMANPLHDKSMQGLVQLGQSGDSSMIVAATLLALNRFESAIRHSTGYTTGRAPLLKTMLQQLPESTLAACCKSLLLPTPGLNLRNLIWHGFVSTLPRQWLALILIVTLQLESNNNNIKNETPSGDLSSLSCMTNFRLYPSFHTMLLDKQHESSSSFLSTMEQIETWLPPSHHGLLHVALDWKEALPACSAALLSILMEHGLRLDWCHLNNRPDHAVAQPGSYYVTLDGHGQKHQHDLLLHPFVGSDDSLPNALVSYLGGATIALLTDLFASSCGGPNIRATLAHGLWDAILDQELASLVVATTTENDCLTPVHEDAVRDCVCILWAAMESVAQSRPVSSVTLYRPQFSYTATTTRLVMDARMQFERLSNCLSSQEYREAADDGHSWSGMRGKHVIQLLHLPKNMLNNLGDRVLWLLCSPESTATTEEWTSQDVFLEYDCNVKLVNCGASRTLLKDVAVSLESFVVSFELALMSLKDANTSSWQRRIHRTCGMAEFAASTYGFALYVAMLSIQQVLDHDMATVETIDGPTMLKAVERSRMCVSTVSTFVTSNSDRAVKAAMDYSKGKAIKEVLSQSIKEGSQ